MYSSKNSVVDKQPFKVIGCLPKNAEVMSKSIEKGEIVDIEYVEVRKKTIYALSDLSK